MLTENDLTIDEIRKKVEEYETTIMALQAFSKTIQDFYNIKDVKAKEFVSYGRKMDTSSSNRIHPNNTATPDTVIQIGDDWGIVIEAKRTMPRNENERWKETVNQIQKYDDDLVGWWTKDGRIKSSNIALLIDVDRSIDFANYLQDLVDSKEITQFEKPTAIVEFFKKQEVKQFLHVREVWGNLEPKELSRRLKSGKSIPVEGLIDNKRFYDQEPSVVEYTMVLLWQVVFTERYLNSDFDEISKNWLIKVDLDELTEYLQKLYGSKSNEERERTYPRRKWIKKALDAFVRLDLAKFDKTNENYTIKFRRLQRGDIFLRFSKHRIINPKNPVKPVNQLEFQLDNITKIDDSTDSVFDEDEIKS